MFAANREKPMPSSTLADPDQAHLIHPVVSLRDDECCGVTVLQSGRGCHLTDASGHVLLGSFASLWRVNTGYGQDSIVEAATEQMRRLPYAIALVSNTARGMAIGRESTWGDPGALRKREVMKGIENPGIKRAMRRGHSVQLFRSATECDCV
jgi:hypothetical protein